MMLEELLRKLAIEGATERDLDIYLKEAEEYLKVLPRGTSFLTKLSLYTIMTGNAYQMVPTTAYQNFITPLQNYINSRLLNPKLVLAMRNITR